MALNIEHVHRKFSALEESRKSHEALWSEAAKYYLPTSMEWNSNGGSTMAKRRGAKIFDDTPAWAAGRFAGAMLGMVMNPTQKWLEFELYSGHDELSHEAKSWLQELRDRVTFAMQAPEVGFYDAMHEHLLDYGIFGEAVMLIDRDPETKMPRFTPYPLAQCYVGVGERRRPNTVFRKYYLDAQSIMDSFGDKVPSVIKKAVEEKKFNEKFAVIHGVFPRKHGIAGGFAVNKPYASVYYLEDKKEVLRESGFDHFPFSVPRFMLFASEEHGQGPGTLSLSNVKALNTIIHTFLIADQQKALPAYLATRRGFIGAPNLSPNHINYYDGFDMDKALLPIGNQGHPQAGREWVQMYQDQILRAFYLDRLNTPQKAAEVKEVEALMGQEESMRDLVPQLSRLHSESISVIILNLVEMLASNMPDPPEDILENSLRIRYLSPLAKAQRMLEVSHANRTLQQIVIPMAQIEPSVTDTVNWKAFSDWTLDHAGFPNDVRVSKEEFEAKQAAKEEQEQMAMGMEAAQGASEVAKNFSQAQQGAPPPLGGFI